MSVINHSGVDIGAEFLRAKRRLFDKVYSRFLNPEQTRAVFTAKGPLLVLAGAGSGKTTVLVNRIAYLIKYGDAYFTDYVPEGVDGDTVEALNYAYEMAPEEIESILPQFIHEPTPPWSVLAFTFTNKAAGEIKERLLKTFGDEELASSIWAGTFHSICLRILRKHADKLGYKDGFSIYDADDSKRLIAQCMKELEIDEKTLAPKLVASMISRAKDELTTPEDFETTPDPRTKAAKAIYALYQRKLLGNNAMDFDDIIMQTVFLLEGYPEVCEYYQRKFRYVLVDEYQDTNHAQFVLTKMLSGGYRNIMVVGDDDQSIYRFRGATIENILDFDKTYPDATVVRLEQNYRSTANILAVANSIIKNNEERHEKRLWCDKGDGAPVTVKEAPDQNSEGRYIVDEIIGGVRKESRAYSDFAVLYRINALGRSLQTTFAKSGIPYRVVGDMSFYDRKEIKDMIAYLAIIASPVDNLRLKRIINEPKRKIGDATVSAIEEIAEMNGMSMYEVIARVDEYPVLKKSAEKLTEFYRLIEEIKSRSALPSELLRAVFLDTGYREMLRGEGFEGEGKIENIEEFISAAVEYEKKMTDADEEPTLLGFLEEIWLISSVDKYDENADAVVLMTVHAAKGLEFPVVFIAGMEDGIFPSESDRNDPREMNEERRLAYVAVTRAKEKLYITHARSRMMYGRTSYGMLSVFIREEVPPHLLHRDTPRPVPPRQSLGFGERRGYNSPTVARNSEIRRTPAGQTGAKRSGAAAFGIEKFAPGTRVSHAAFGEGVILSARDMGGDILYEVAFEGGVTKKLMATFAKLKRV